MSSIPEYTPLVVLAASSAVLFSTFDASVFEEQRKYHETFSERDHQSFDRDFEFRGSSCEVGIERKRICFRPSPFETKIEVGETIPRSAPAMPATVPVIMRTTLKSPELSTYRYGRTLVLVNEQSGMVVDKMNLLSELDPPKQDETNQTFAASIPQNTNANR